MNLPADDRNFSFKSLVLPFYVPSGLAFLGLGMLIPMLPLFASNMGATVAGASFVVGLYGLGNLIFNIPAGLLNSKFDKKRVMLVALFIAFLFVVFSAYVASPWLLGLSMFFFGGARTTFFITRLSFFRSRVPMKFRARALAIISGEFRFGNFLGPIIGGIVAEGFGYRWTLLLCSLLFGLSFFTFFFWLPSSFPDTKNGTPAGKNRSLDRIGAILKENSKTFATAGVAIIVLQLMRTARQVLVPLIGVSKGLDVSQIGLVIGLVFLLELIVFYPAAMVMDRWGRKVIAVPCLLLFAIGFSLLPLATGFLTLILAAMVTGVGNGLGSGLNMILSSDFAPKENSGEFLGVWRFFVDFGTSGGPFVVGAIAGILSLGAASLVISTLGIAGAAVMVFLVPEPHRATEQ